MRPHRAPVPALCSILLGLLMATGLWRSIWAAGPILTLGNGRLELAESETAPLTMNVSGIDGLYGFEVVLAFDPSALEVVDADPGTAGVQAAPGDFLALDFLVRNGADNTEGTVEFALTQLNPSEAKAGGGNLLTVYFRGKKAGSSTTVRIERVKLANRAGEEIAATATGANVIVGSGAAVTAEPTPLPSVAEARMDMAVLTQTPQPTAIPAASTTVPSALQSTKAPAATAAPEMATATPLTLAKASVAEVAIGPVATVEVAQAASPDSILAVHPSTATAVAVEVARTDPILATTTPTLDAGKQNEPLLAEAQPVPIKAGAGLAEASQSPWLAAGGLVSVAVALALGVIFLPRVRR